MTCPRHIFAPVFFALVLALFSGPSFAHGQSGAPTSASIAPKVSRESAPGAVMDFERSVANVLKEKDFDRLEQLANKLRSGKERWPGGRWVLSNFYEAVERPEPGMDVTEEDWNQHLQLVKDWVSMQPKSITARIALADSYIAYAWDARGGHFADKVTESGWRLFGERVAEAKRILDDAAKLDAHCPQWYRSMQEVALAQAWDLEQENALLQQAIAFEPQYYTFYRQHARYLETKWYGEEGDAQRFAEMAANRLGGDQGDVLYFEFASEFTCTCEIENSAIKTMDWERIQRGYQTAERLYGVSYIKMNQIALMATIIGDSIAADDYLTRIGENRFDIWDQKYFDSIKQWAAAFAPIERMNRDADKFGPENMKTPEGQQFAAEFQRILEKGWSACLPSLKNTPLHPFQLKLRLAADGTVNGGTSFKSEDSPLMRCVYQSLGSRKPFSTKPPKPDYWLVFDVDPAKLASVAARAGSNPGT